MKFCQKAVNTSHIRYVQHFLQIKLNCLYVEVINNNNYQQNSKLKMEHWFLKKFPLNESLLDKKSSTPVNATNLLGR